MYLHETPLSRAIEIGKWMTMCIDVIDAHPLDHALLSGFIQHFPGKARATPIDKYVDTKIIQEFERRFGRYKHRGLWDIEWVFVKGISYQYFFDVLSDRLGELYRTYHNILGDDIDRNSYYIPVDLLKTTKQVDLIVPIHILDTHEKQQNSPPSSEGLELMVHPEEGEI